MEISEMVSRRSFVRNSILTSAAVLGHGLAARAESVFGAAGVAAVADAPRFGVNYVPRKRWWYCWLDWDQAAIEEDLSGIAGLGLDHIRIQCLWPHFQPGIGTVSERALDHLHQLLDTADKAGLDVEVTVLNGWMSGLSFMPPWVAPLVDPWHGKAGNIFTDAKVIEAEKLLFRRIAETVGGHRRFLGFDIGNELGVLQGTNGNRVTPAEADAWATEMLQLLRPGCAGEVSREWH